MKRVFVFAARLAASRFVVRRGKAQRRRDAWRPIALHWRKTRRRLEMPRDRRTGTLGSSTSVWLPQFHLHFAAPFHREPFSPRGFLQGEKVPKADEGGVNAIVAIYGRAQMKYACTAPSSAYRHPSTRFARSGQALLPRKKPQGRRTLDVGRGQTSPVVVSPPAYRVRTSVVEPIRKGIRASASRSERSHLFQTHAPIGRGELRLSYRRPQEIADIRRASASTPSQQVIVRPPDLVYRRELRSRTEIADQPSRPGPAASSPARSAASLTTAPEASSAKRPAPLRMTDLDPAFVDRLTDDVIRRVERRVRIERERRGL